MSQLTGRSRYRQHAGWDGGRVLILQVEIECSSVDQFGMSDTYTAWRDATVEDLSVMDTIPKLKVAK